MPVTKRKAETAVEDYAGLTFGAFIEVDQNTVVTGKGPTPDPTTWTYEVLRRVAGTTYRSDGGMDAEQGAALLAQHNRRLGVNDYTQELGEDLCGHLANGGKVNEWCRAHNLDAAMIWRWEQRHPEFRQALARAREAQAFYWANEIVELADDSTDDWMEVNRGTVDKPRMVTLFNRDHYERVRTKIQTRQWLMAKYSPKLFGEKIEVEQTGAPGRRDLEGLIRIAKERARQMGQPEPDFSKLLGRQG